MIILIIVIISVMIYREINFLVSPISTGDKDHPQYVEPPVIPGHEFFGEVVKLGKGMYIHINLESLNLKTPYMSDTLQQ